MSGSRLPPDDPREWLRRARSSLRQARGGIQWPEVYLEDLCFQAQQAAEKAIKGVLVAMNLHFPYTHDLAVLLSVLESAGVALPEEVRNAAGLSDYAVAVRYLGVTEPVSRGEYDEALALAEAVLD